VLSAEQYGLNVQVRVAPRTVAEVGYVGSHGVALPVETLVNQAIIASASRPVNGVTMTTTANVQSRVTYVGFSPSGLIYLQTIGSSVYNSLQSSLTQQMNHGLQMLASYTYSKAMDTASASSDGVTFNNFNGDQTNIAQNWGPSDYDRTHRFVLSGIYSLPAFGFGLNDTWFGKKAFSGRELAGVGTVQSGLPFSITDAAGGAFYGATTSAASYGSLRSYSSPLWQGRGSTQ
jgi:hypothetical protein